MCVHFERQVLFYECGSFCVIKPGGSDSTLQIQNFCVCPRSPAATKLDCTALQQKASCRARSLMVSQVTLDLSRDARS